MEIDCKATRSNEEAAHCRTINQMGVELDTQGTGFLMHLHKQGFGRPVMHDMRIYTLTLGFRINGY